MTELTAEGLLEALPGIGTVVAARASSSTEGNEYIFFRQGGWSWSMPSIAGSGRAVRIRERALGPIVDPVALIGALERR